MKFLGAWLKIHFGSATQSALFVSVYEDRFHAEIACYADDFVHLVVVLPSQNWYATNIETVLYISGCGFGDVPIATRFVDEEVMCDFIAMDRNPQAGQLGREILEIDLSVSHHSYTRAFREKFDEWVEMIYAE